MRLQATKNTVRYVKPLFGETRVSHAKIMRDIEATKRRYEQIIVLPKTYKQRLKEIFLTVGIFTVNDFVERIGLSNKVYYSTVNEEPADLDADTVSVISNKLQFCLALYNEITELWNPLDQQGTLLHQAIEDLHTIYTSYTTDERAEFLREARKADWCDREAKSKRIAAKRAADRTLRAPTESFIKH